MRRLALTFVLLATFAAPADAAEPWGEARSVDRGDDIGAVAAGIDERGYIVAAWTRRAGDRVALVGARRTPRRGFGRTFTLRAGTHTPSEPHVEFDGRRTALIGYRRWHDGAHRIELRALRPSGRRTTPQLIAGSGSSATLTSFADPAFGRPVFAWARRDPSGELRFARIDATGRVTRVITWDFEGSVTPASVAADPGGRVVVAFVRDGRVNVARRTADDQAIVAQPVSDASATAREPSLAVAPDGRAVIAWTEDGPGDSERVMAAERPAGRAAFGPPQQLAGGGLIYAPRVTASSRSDMYVMWIASNRGSTAGAVRGPLVMSRLEAAKPPVAQPVSAVAQDVEQFDAAADDRGGVTAAWVTDVADEPGGPLYARAITPAGVLGKAQRLSPDGERTGSFDLAVGERGDAFALWATRGGGRLRAARRPE